MVLQKGMSGEGDCSFCSHLYHMMFGGSPFLGDLPFAFPKKWCCILK